MFSTFRWKCALPTPSVDLLGRWALEKVTTAAQKMEHQWHKDEKANGVKITRWKCDPEKSQPFVHFRFQLRPPKSTDS